MKFETKYDIGDHLYAYNGRVEEYQIVGIKIDTNRNVFYQIGIISGDEIFQLNDEFGEGMVGILLFEDRDEAYANTNYVTYDENQAILQILDNTDIGEKYDFSILNDSTVFTFAHFIDIEANCRILFKSGLSLINQMMKTTDLSMVSADTLDCFEMLLLRLGICD